MRSLTRCSLCEALSLLGLRPLDRAISPLLVLSSGLSIVAIVRLGDPGLWFGGVCDMALLLIGVWRAGAFVLLPTEDGRTRLVIRSTFSNPDIPVWAAALEFMAFELPHVVMERRMMLGIKALAERHGGIEAAAR